MAVKSASASHKKTSTKEGVEIIVKRGATRRFHTLKRDTAEMPVTILWDRRTNERRNVADAAARASERRGTDRRKKPSFTWDLADFVVVAPTKGQKSARKKPSKRA